MPDIELRQLDGDDPTTVRVLLPGFRETMAAALPADPPASETLLARLLQRRQGTDRIVVAAFDGGHPTGYAKLGLDTTGSSETGHGSLWVFPSHRRSGAGSALLAACRAELRRRGRSRLLVDAPRTPESAMFAARLGGRSTATTLRMRISRADVECGGVAPGPPGYRTVRWKERCPEELVDAFAFARRHLDVPLNGQAPAGGTTASTVRAREEEALRTWHRQYVVAAVAESDGAVLGYSTMYVRDAPMADAGETLVLPAHRRAGLATAVKAQLLNWAFAAEPGLATVQAWNDESALPIVALNRTLGHVPTGAWSTWEFPV